MATLKNRIVREKIISQEAVDSRVAGETAKALSAADPHDIRIEIAPKGDAPRVVLDLPPEAVRLLARILSEMAEGSALTLVARDAELSTQQAADLLRVSRPFVVDLMEKGNIPFRTVGQRRRVQFKDLMAYKKRSEARREVALQELADQAQELDMGY